MSSGRAAAPHLSTYSRLELLMRERYTVEQLVNLDAGAFREGLNAFLQLDDAAMEGYTDPQRQRDLSVRFRWGHNHDFGTFALQGEMQNRHLWLLSSYIDQFGLPESLDGQRVLDIGAWTGGTSLLLHAMGAEVVAIEEVRKYAEAIEYLAHAFSLTRLSVIQASLFDCHGSLFDDRFDYVLFAGVLYHVSDPILALRHTFNALRDGGTCLLETYAIAAEGAVLKYEGARVFGSGSASDRTRTGWNWFDPRPRRSRRWR